MLLRFAGRRPSVSGALTTAHLPLTRIGRQGTYSPYEQAELTPEQLTTRKTEWDADRDKHWRVDTAKGEIVSDGQGVHLVTARE